MQKASNYNWTVSFPVSEYHSDAYDLFADLGSLCALYDKCNVTTHVSWQIQQQKGIVSIILNVPVTVDGTLTRQVVAQEGQVVTCRLKDGDMMPKLTIDGTPRTC